MDVVVGIYGALLAAGGGMGYAKKKSLPSLVAGGGCGLFFIYAAQDVDGYDFQCKVLSSLLCIGMSIRAGKSGKFMPAGMVATLSLGVLYYLFSRKP
mmetsp:Transcript_814/g.1305  ORF Transcript_814/g.1305 Transcript_814/m.1305 type:complete len:97 (-) Transcript_814:1236-1526(-)